MELLQGHLLSTVVFLPLAGLALLLLIPKEKTGLIKWTGLGVSILTFLTSLLLFTRFDASTAGMQFVEKASWIPQYGISYYLGIDGISLLLILLTTFLMPLALIGSWTSITKHVKGFFCINLLLLTGMVGVFAAVDMILFYVFWEVTLIPMYFIIGMWGGKRRIYATMKFVLYTMIGSLLMLVAIIALVWFHKQEFGFYATALSNLLSVSVPVGANFFNPQMLLFLAFLLAFLIKVPMFPFHTWLPDAHVEAPTAGSVILAGVLLKMGTYGLVRFAMPLFPDALSVMTPLLLILSVIGIVYGALVAWVQPDIKKLVAYSSVSHLGFCTVGLLALNSMGVTGSLYQMISHGLTTGALFLIVGVLYERKHTRMIADLGGLSKELPWFAVAFMIVMLGSVGLPGTSGFVGEFLVLIGLFQTHPIYAVIAVSGVVLGAVYMLSAYQRLMFGKYNPGKAKSKDLNLREKLIFIPLIIVILWMGIKPDFFISKVEKSIDHFVYNFHNYTLTEAEKYVP
ncbi:NADH-quinone oxidoreductase subunit M [Bdellovibrionota bacterium]